MLLFIERDCCYFFYLRDGFGWLVDRTIAPPFGLLVDVYTFTAPMMCLLVAQVKAPAGRTLAA